jgi:hypothetical protein
MKLLILLTLFTANAFAQSTPIDTLRIDYPTYSIAFYGCQSTANDTSISAYCSGHDVVTSLTPSSTDIQISVGTVAPGTDDFYDSGQCTLTSASTGTLGENQYEVACNPDILFRNNFGN